MTEQYSRRNFLKKSAQTGIGIVAGALALGGAGCDIKSNDKSHTNKSIHNSDTTTIQTKNISGEIVDIDEDSFAIYNNYNGGGSNFNFEVLRIKNIDGEIYKIISPHPSSYRVGDKIETKYRPIDDNKISLHQLVRENWENYQAFSQQKGIIEANGILE